MAFVASPLPRPAAAASAHPLPRCGRGISQLLDAGAGAVLVLLRGAAADPAGALDDAVADDRHRALTHDHVAALGRGDAARRRLVGPRLHFAAGAAERGRGDR